VVRRVSDTHERRQANRLPPEQTPWRRTALIRPGHEVQLVDLSSGGALVESSARLKPGLRTELHLHGAHRRSIVGRIDRCRVTALDPIRYQGAIVFDQHQHW
jgi:hypothetical protein